MSEPVRRQTDYVMATYGCVNPKCNVATYGVGYGYEVNCPACGHEGEEQ